MIIGHKKQQEALKKIINSRVISHAILFSGPGKVGKRTIALDLISSIFQDELKGHPDFLLIEPYSKQIQIEQIRNLNWKLSLKPIKAKILGAVIDEAHSMTKEAQNCFLKTLEEPKAKSILILVSEHPKFLLPTILSRCENVKFYPVSPEEIKDYLKGKVSQESIDEIVDFSLGRPGIAVNFIENPEKIKELKGKIKILSDMLGSPLSSRFEYAEELSEKEDIIETLGVWLFYFRKNLIKCRDKRGFQKIKEILDGIHETIYLLSTTNANVRLSLETLMMKL